LDLKRFLPAGSSAAEAQRASFELASAAMAKKELGDALETLRSSSGSLGRARALLAGETLASEEKALSDVADHLGSQLTALEEQTKELKTRMAQQDGTPAEKSVAAFLEGIVDESVVTEQFHEFLGVDTLQKLSDLLLGAEGSEDMLLEIGLQDAQVKAIVKRLEERTQQGVMYDIHALVAYLGTGVVGHYISVVRQSDGAFFLFDDERVTEHATADAVRIALDNYGGGINPAVVRTLLYRRRGAPRASSGEQSRTATVDAPLELPGPRVLRAADRKAENEASAAKRPRTE
jgi:hypothetical protein